MIEDETNRIWDLPLVPGGTLEVQSDFATLTLMAVRDGELPSVEARRHLGAEADVRVTQEGDRTLVRATGPKVKLVLHVPADVRATVRSAAGRVHAENLAGGTLDLKTEAGSIMLVNVGGKLTIATEAGKIDGENVRGTLDVRASAGAVRLEIAHLEPGTHRIRTNVGALRVELARGLAVRVDARTTMGASKVEFPSTRDAAATLELTADVGAIKVRESSRLAEAPPPSAAGPYRTSTTSSAAPAHGPTPPVPEPALDQILERVARGELTPAAAADLLRELRRG